MFPLFDAHCDTASAVYARYRRKQEGSLRKNDCQTDLSRGAAYSLRGQVYALWQDAAGYTPEELQDCFRAMLEQFRREAELNQDLLSLCTCYAEICTAFRNRKQAAVLSVEGAELFGCSRDGLHYAWKNGVRIVHLCWNYDNLLCGAAAGSGAGLTAQGRDFVRLCGELGMIVDLSHASDQTAWDVLELAAAPVMASHSDCRAVTAVPRNLPDDLLRAIPEAGGVVGLNLYPPFLGGTDPAQVIVHAAHLVELCGRKHVCLGCDFDGVDALPEGITGVESMSRLRHMLAGNGAVHALLDDLFFNNLMDFWERSL